MNETVLEGLAELRNATDNEEQVLPKKTLDLYAEVFGKDSPLLPILTKMTLNIPESLYTDDKDVLPFWLITKLATGVVPVIGRIWAERLNTYLNTIATDETLLRNKALNTLILEDIIRLQAE